MLIVVIDKVDKVFTRLKKCSLFSVDFSFDLGKIIND